LKLLNAGLVLLLHGCLPMAAGEEKPATKIVPLPEMRVQGMPPLGRLPDSSGRVVIDPLATPAAADAADYVEATPGAAVVRNGALTGIVQLRGMHNERVKILLDGMTLTPACPNHMDPPLHYVAPSDPRSLTVMAGITPVSLGGDSLAGSVVLESPDPLFANDPSGTALGEVGLRLESGNRGLGFDGRAAAASPTADDAYRLRGRYTAELGWGRLRVSGFGHAIDHLMDNYSLRPAGPMRMFSPAESRDFGGAVEVVLPRGDHELGLGLDLHGVRFDAYQENAVTHARQDSLNDNRRDRLGAYAEWSSEWTSKWETQLGLRVDGVFSDAADVEQSFPPASADRLAFNSREHQREDVNLDGTALVRYRLTSVWAVEAGYARKNRAPSLLERYLWTPLSASAGQADGRSYLGDLDLDPESSDQVGLTVAARWTNATVRITPFYQWVQDYIQGTPISRLDAQGRPVLQFQNQGRVELYGVDAEANYDIRRWLGILGLLSYVRGRNLSTDDNLYRVAPLRGAVALEHRWSLYTGTLEVVLADDQTHVSRYNAEPPTPGYALLNLRTRFQVHPHLELALALENVFDEVYSDHLGGINRVNAGDVAVGQRLPGMGRSLIAQLRARF